MSVLINGYEFYKSVQGSKYDKSNLEIKNKLQEFRENLGKFTDKIFHNFIPLEKGMWQNSGNFTKYMWNRYKPQNDNSSLVIYFNASTNKEGLFISIGLIDDKLKDFEKENSQKIYDYLEEGCKKITSEGFIRKNTGWGEKVFSVDNEQNFENLNYSDLISKLKNLYDDTYENFYSQESFDINLYEYLKKKKNDNSQGKYVYFITKYLVENYSKENYIDKDIIENDIEHEKIGKNITNDFSHRITKPQWKNDYIHMSKIISWISQNNLIFNQEGNIDIEQHNLTNPGEVKIKYKIVDSQINQLRKIFEKLEINNNGVNEMINGIKQTLPLNQILYGSPGTGYVK